MSKLKNRKPIKFKPKELNIDVMFPDTAWSGCRRCENFEVVLGIYSHDEVGPGQADPRW